MFILCVCHKHSRADFIKLNDNKLEYLYINLTLILL
jgi:hypothetical protein